MDNVNFTGFKNTGFLNLLVTRADAPFGLRKSSMIIQLTDDYSGKDLTEFNNVIKKCGEKGYSYKFPYDSRFLHLMTAKFEDGVDIPALFVNWIKVPVERKMMPLFTHIAKITKKIAKMPSDKFVIENDFKYGPDGNEYIFAKKKLTEMMPPTYLEHAIDIIYSPYTCKQGAGVINNDIQTQMMDYLA